MYQTLRFKSSGYLGALLTAFHLAALIALGSLVFPLWAKLALMLVLAVNFAYLMLRDVLLKLPSSCVAISLGKEGAGIFTRNGKKLPCNVLDGSLVMPFITVVKVLPQGARFARSTVILPDALDAESFRQLRVWLKWGA